MRQLLLIALLLPLSAFAAGDCEQFVQDRIGKSNRDLGEAVRAFDDLFRDYTVLPPTAAAVQARLRQAKPKPAPDCAELRDTRFLYDAVSLKLKYLPEQLRKAGQILETLRAPRPKLAPAESAAMVACLRGCVMRNAVSPYDLKATDACVSGCKVNEQTLDYIRGNDTLSLFLAEDCRDPGSGELDRKSVARMIDKGETVAGTLTRSMQRSWKKYHQRAERLVSALRKEQEELAARIKKQPVALACPMDEAVKAMRAGTVRLEVEARGSGTGFYVAAPNGKSYLASARHVPALGGEYDEPMYAVTKTGGQLLRFRQEPGRYDYENDAVLEETDPQEHGLPLVRSGEQPAFGQLFRVGGFPGFAGEKFVSVECRFLGYGPNMNGGQAYFLHCPVNGTVKGMSGGPVVSEDGRVWAIVVNQTEERGLLVASALSAAATGEPQLGITGTFLSDHCYGDIQLPQPPHRCEVFPGSLVKPAALPND